MNEQFVTEAIQNDRCLKVARLLDRFESELETELERVGKRIVEKNGKLFADDVGSNVRVKFNANTILANARDNLDMYRVNPDKPGKTQKLNISIRWVDPLDWGEEGVDGALCAACYKVNNGHPADFSQVKQETVEGDWDVRFGNDQYNNAPGLFYIPVESARGVRDAMETLQAHFSEFGEYWGNEPREINGKDN